MLNVGREREREFPSPSLVKSCNAPISSGSENWVHMPHKRSNWTNAVQELNAHTPLICSKLTESSTRNRIKLKPQLTFPEEAFFWGVAALPFRFRLPFWLPQASTSSSPASSSLQLLSFFWSGAASVTWGLCGNSVDCTSLRRTLLRSKEPAAAAGGDGGTSETRSSIARKFGIRRIRDFWVWSTAESRDDGKMLRLLFPPYYQGIPLFP